MIHIINARMASQLILLIAACLADGSGKNRLIDPLCNEAWGSCGSYLVDIDTFTYFWKEKPHQVFTFLPNGKEGRYPVILFCHGINETDYNSYSGLIYHIVSNGYGVVYAPYKSIPFSNKLQTTYDGLKTGLMAGVLNRIDLLDTNRIGFIGHSFGGGAVPYIARKLLMNQQWGSEGSFLYIMAPWYPCVISKHELQEWPADVNMVMQVFDDDRINDPRIARTLFSTIGIPQSNKRYIILYSDSIPGCKILADHSFPCKYTEQITVYEKNGLLRTFDLLASASFKCDSMASAALFSSDVNSWQKLANWHFNHPVREALFTTMPRIEHPQSVYVNFWDHAINPFNEFNTNFDLPKPFLFHTRVTLRNYWRTICDRMQRQDEDAKHVQHSYSVPMEGFGSSGRWFMESRTIANPRLRTRPVQVFLPENDDSLRPVILLSHSFLTPLARNYQGLIEHLVSRGNIVIYASSGVIKVRNVFNMRYDILMSGFQEALDLYRHRIDTTRIGFIGNAFAAGAMPAIALKFLREQRWGENGSYFFLSAPWFSYYLDKNELESFPENSKVVIMVYQDDRINDWRMGFDVYKSIGLPDSSKNFIILFSDKKSNVNLRANHQTMLCRKQGRFVQDALDFYGIYRTIDALEACAFYDDPDGRLIALGKNNPAQQYMGTWHDGTPIRKLLVTEEPERYLHNGPFFFSWQNMLNKRKQTDIRK